MQVCWRQAAAGDVHSLRLRKVHSHVFLELMDVEAKRYMVCQWFRCIEHVFPGIFQVFHGISQLFSMVFPIGAFLHFLAVSIPSGAAREHR